MYFVDEIIDSASQSWELTSLFPCWLCTTQHDIWDSVLEIQKQIYQNKQTSEIENILKCPLFWKSETSKDMDIDIMYDILLNRPGR